jgi:hypothetical protein
MGEATPALAGISNDLAASRPKELAESVDITYGS